MDAYDAGRAAARRLDEGLLRRGSGHTRRADEIKRLPTGEFAPRGLGQILRRHAKPPPAPRREKLSPGAPYEMLRDRWADLDRDLLPFAGNPRAPEAREILDEQRDIAKAIHHKDLDTGGPEGVGKPGGPRDVVIVGAGPAGMQAAINGGTEGLDTLLLDSRSGPGGQAGMSSRIENVMGFPAGVTGTQLATWGLEQAQRVGAETKFGVRAIGLDYDEKSKLKTIHLSNGDSVQARTVILAGGVEFTKLTPDRVRGADAAGVVYGHSGELRRQAKGGDAVLIGGANSAGQAAIDTASDENVGHVTLLIRGNSIADKMSDYLVHQLRTDPKVTILERAEAAEFGKDADGHLQSVTLKDGTVVPARGAGVFIGSRPGTSWTGLDHDEQGYLTTGGDGRDTLETSMPGVYAAGDGRAGTVHRVATSAGDGSMALAQTFQFLPSVGGKALKEAAKGGGDVADEFLDRAYALDDEFPGTCGDEGEGMNPYEAGRKAAEKLNEGLLGRSEHPSGWAAWRKRHPDGEAHGSFIDRIAHQVATGGPSGIDRAAHAVSTGGPSGIDRAAHRISDPYAAGRAAAARPPASPGTGAGVTGDWPRGAAPMVGEKVRTPEGHHGEVVARPSEALNADPHVLVRHEDGSERRYPARHLKRAAPNPKPPSSPGTTGGGPGRGPHGEVRNFAAMKTPKLLHVASQMVGSGDGEALRAVIDEIKSRGLGGEG